MNSQANRDAPSLDLCLTRALSVQRRIVMFRKDNCCSIVEQFISKYALFSKVVLYPLSLFLSQFEFYIVRRQCVINFFSKEK